MGDDELTTIARTGLALLSIGIFVLLPCRQSLAMHGPAHDDKSVLILGSTVTGGPTSLEAVRAAANGFTVEVTDATGWKARTPSDFSTYRAIILGDPSCFAFALPEVDDPTTPKPIDAAKANRNFWGPAINGNVIIIGTDPALHRISATSTADQKLGATQLTESGIKF